MTRKVVSPIALDKSINTTEPTPRNIADVLAQQLEAIKTAIESGNGNLEAAFVCYYGVTTATQIKEAIEDGKVPYFYYNGAVAQLWKVETEKYTFRTTNTRSVEGQTILDVVDYVVNGSVWSTITREVSGGSSSGQSYIASVNSLANFDTTGKSGMQDLISVANVPADGVYQVSVMLHITPKTASATKSDLVLQFTSSDNTGWPNHIFHAVVDDSQTFAQQLSFSTSVSLKAGQNTLRIQCGGLNTEYLVFVDELTLAQLVNGVYHNGDDFDEVHTLPEAADFNNDDGVLVDGATGGPRFMLWRTLANKVLGFIKSLYTTITAFRTGDVIPVDGPSGTAKMPYAYLLAIARDGLAEKDEITNIYDDATFGTQGFIGGDGAVKAIANFERTDYIPIEAGDFITYSLYEYAITGDAPASMAIFAFYDSTKTFISAVTQIAGTNGFINGKFDTIPANAKFVIISNKSNVNPDGWAHVYTFSSSKFAELEKFVDSIHPEAQYNGRIIKSIGKDIDEWADYGWDDESVLTSNADVVSVYFERNTGRKHPSLVTRVRYYSKVGYTATLYKVVLNGTSATTTSVMALGDGATSGWINYDVSIPLKENEYLGINGKFVYKVAGDSFGDEKITAISSGTTGTWYTGALGLFYEGLVEDGIAERLDEFAQYSINGGDHKLLPSAIVDGGTITFDPFSIPMTQGYIKDDGSVGSPFNSNFGYISMDVHGIKTLTMNGSGDGIATIHHAVLVFPDGQIRTFFGADVSGVLTFTFKKEFVGKLYLNRFGGATPISNGNWSIEYYSKEQMRSFDLRILPDIIRRPFDDWSTKKVCFCGDSIVKGFTSGSIVTTYTWPYWLNNKLNFASYDNIAVGGSMWQDVSGHNWVKTQIQTALSGNYDVLFIGCGINDYAKGGDIGDFVDAVNDVLDYINSNYPNTTQFIFITPINEAGWHAYDNSYRIGVSSLDDYRFAIQSCVTKKDTYHRFSVLDGKRFGFPTIECDDGAFVSAVFGDKLHPSEKGYADIYAPAMLERIV